MSLSLVENVIVAGADNHPPMLDKTQYSSWASHMLLYIKGKENQKLFVDSVLNEPFDYGMVTKAGSATTPERESKMYDEFNMFTSIPEETIHSYYLRSNVTGVNRTVGNDTVDIDITSDSNMISYEQHLKETENAVVQDTSSSEQQDAMIMSVIEEISNHVAKCNEIDKVVQIILWYLDSGCSKYMTGQRSQLINFVSKFMGIVRFRNDHVVAIRGYEDYQIRNIMISQVYYVEGLGHNLFSVGEFCDSDLKVAFCKHTCFVRDMEGVDLLKGSRGSNLYTLSLEEMMLSSLFCLLSKASKTKSWLWHRRLSHLNFGYINELAKQGLVRGLPKLKYQKC
nr:integrase, catalytic region, zinc finger, CCHC-type, peptidase aspartic, catalytic [Tanacetum cinerariifolium]